VVTNIRGIACDSIEEPHLLVSGVDCEEVTSKGNGTLQERVSLDILGALGIDINSTKEASRSLDPEHLHLASGRIQEDAAAEARIEHSLGLTGEGPLHENLGDGDWSIEGS
jgi:hypothetical protein